MTSASGGGAGGAAGTAVVGRGRSGRCRGGGAGHAGGSHFPSAGVGLGGLPEQGQVAQQHGRRRHDHPPGRQLGEGEGARSDDQDQEQAEQPPACGKHPLVLLVPQTVAAPRRLLRSASGISRRACGRASVPASLRHLAAGLRPGFRTASLRHLAAGLRPGFRTASLRHLAAGLRPGFRTASLRHLAAGLWPGFRTASLGTSRRACGRACARASGRTSTRASGRASVRA